MTILRFSPPHLPFLLCAIVDQSWCCGVHLPKSSRWTIVERSSLRATRLASVWVFVDDGDCVAAVISSPWMLREVVASGFEDGLDISLYVLREKGQLHR
ncbi:hypothetical protein BC826DRAFT_127315 [Russula brevipes]|nr:hypothetical protein BC826DRAFT_127315 [Russula brevipes]